MRFKVGELVVCVFNGEGCEGLLVVGRVYTVTDWGPNNTLTWHPSRWMYEVDGMGYYTENHFERLDYDQDEMERLLKESLEEKVELEIV